MDHATRCKGLLFFDQDYSFTNDHYHGSKYANYRHLIQNGFDKTIQLEVEVYVSKTE